MISAITLKITDTTLNQSLKAKKAGERNGRSGRVVFIPFRTEDFAHRGGEKIM
jgi:hypothetical protein